MTVFAVQSEVRQPEHLQMAANMTNEILSRFSLDEQNEAILFICQRIKESRINETHELEKRIEVIKKSLASVPLTPMQGAMEQV